MTAIPKGATFRQQLVNCGKSKCRVCRGGRYRHGPYWYAFWMRKGRSSSRYVGKKLPPGRHGQELGEAEWGEVAERDRHLERLERDRRRRPRSR